MARATMRFGLVLLALLAALVLKGQLLELPSVRQDNEAGTFDAERAFARLERILAEQQPHGVDTPANDIVRARIVDELRQAGLQPRIVDEVSCNTFRRNRALNCGRIRNVVVTIGPREGRHLLFVSHYDSSAAAIGASDDGIGVATMIEVAALLRDAPLQRPVTFLFNEGEETGLNGARLFLDSDPAAPLVDTLVNLEARGTSGPAIMFETSRPNAPAIATFAQGTRRPFANSLSTDFYRLIPNSTDVTVFEERPWTILNFAIIGGESRYHSMGDNLAAFDLRSLRHMGGEALGIARAVAIEGTPSPEGERIYADFYGLFLVTMPLLLGLALLGALILIFAIAAWRQRAFGRPLLTAAAAVLLATGLAFAAHYLVSLFRAGDYWRGYPLVTFAAIYAAALFGCAAALLTLGRRAPKNALRIAAWLLLLLVGAGICFVAQGAAIYFLFPPLLVALGALVGRKLPAAARIAAIAGALLLFLTFAEIMTLIEMLLIDGPYWVLATLAALATLPLLVEALPETQPVRRPAILWPALGTALALWGAVLLVPRATADRQQLFGIEYVLNAATREARWAVTNKRVPLPAGWEGLGDWQLTELPFSNRPRWTSPAPVLPVPPAGVEVTGTRQTPQGRLVSIALRPNGADTIALKLPPGARLRQGGVPGALRTFGGGSNQAPYWVRCAGRSCDGMQLDLLFGGNEPVVAEVIATRFALPAQAAPLLQARPADSRPQYTPDSTYVISRARL